MVAAGEFVEGRSGRHNHLEVLACPFAGNVEAEPFAFRSLLETAPAEAQVHVLARGGLTARELHDLQRTLRVFGRVLDTEADAFREDALIGIEEPEREITDKFGD